MDSADNFSDFSDSDEKNQTSIYGNSSTSNTSDEKRKASLKRKFTDFMEESTPLKLFRKKDTDQNDALENREKVASDENISTDENIQFEKRNYKMANKVEINFNSVSSDKNADCTMMNRNEEYCECFDPVLNNWMNEICSDLNLEPISHEDLDVMIQDIDGNFLNYMDLDEPTTPQNENANKYIGTETEDEILSPSKLEFMMPLLDDCTSLQYPTSSHSLTWNESEDSDISGYGESSVWKYDLIPSKKHSVETVDIQNNSNQIIMDDTEELTSYDPLRGIIYMDVNGRKTFEGNEIANKYIGTETEDETLSPSKFEFMLPLLDDCTSLQYPTSSHNLTWNESEDSDITGYGESSVWKYDMIPNKQHSVKTVDIQNNINQIIMDDIEEQTTYELPRGMYNMDVNGRKTFEGNEISNKTKVTEFPTVMPMPLDDNSTIKSPVLCHTDTLVQNDLTTNVMNEQKSTKILELENISERTTEANENVSDRSKNKEKSKKRKFSGSKNKREILKKEATLEKERILSSIKEYLQNAKMEDFTLHDITDFITKRVPSAPYFKVIHTVRVFVANSLKSGALKQIGYKYSLRSNISDMFV